MTRVLLVDDKEDNLYYLRSLLGAHGYEIETARHGAEALSKARALHPDLVVSDLLMPVMDGYTLLRHWKLDAQLRAAPFIVYTATYTEEEDERLALDLGADAFILKPSEPDVFLARLRAALAQQTCAPVEPAAPARDEGELLREYSSVLVRKLEEKTLQVEATNLSLQQDITARIRAETARDEAQRQAEERAALLDAVFTSVPDVVVHLDPIGNARLMNRASPLFSEHARPAFACGPPEQQALLRREFEEVIRTGQAKSFELDVRRERDCSSCWISFAPVLREGKIRGVVAVVRDISERKLSEAQLMVADRMASLGSLAAGVAHEINNPLLCVTGNLELMERMLELQQHADLPADLHAALSDAREGAERVRLIVRDLRIFSRVEDVSLGPVQVEQVLDSSLRMAWNELRHRAHLRKSYGGVPPVHSNEARLGQVFLNLIVNAVQAIAEGDRERNEVCVTTSVEAATQRVIISISDTGSGMPPEIEARVFSPFVTTKPPGVGTGLGLSICHRIVTSLGGSIDFATELGRGTTFRVSLPMATSAMLSAPDASWPPGLHVRRGHILLIDDDDMVAQVVRRALLREHAVTTLSSAAAALELFRRGERFDVVLCDLMMPQMSGIDLHRELQALDEAQAARVVFMTGGAFTPRARSFLDSVPNGRIEKPFEISALRALVNRQLC